MNRDNRRKFVSVGTALRLGIQPLHLQHQVARAFGLGADDSDLARASQHHEPESMPSPTLGLLLRDMRVSQGRSQQRVAQLLCEASGVPTITRHEVSRWERERRVPAGPWLSWLAVVLDVPLVRLEFAAAVTRATRAT
jgi:DNA-binding transcriptional regulator YiaG